MAPFVSKAQQRYLFAKEPEVAKEFAEHTAGSAYAKLPEHVGKKKAKPTRPMAMKPLKKGKK